MSRLRLSILMLMLGGCGRWPLVDAKADVAANVGANTSNQIGGNQTIDSETAKYAIWGLVAVSLGLGGATIQQRRNAQGARGAAGLVIKQLEARRRREPCDCGECATCIIESLRTIHGKHAKYLHRCVKRETA